MNANLLHLLLAIVVTARITDIHAYRKGHFDRPVDERDAKEGINDFDDEYDEGNRESNEIKYNDPRDKMDISSEYDIEQLCSITDSLEQYYEGNCMSSNSQIVNEDDVKSAHDEMSFDNHPDESEVIENHDNVPDGTVDISTDLDDHIQHMCTVIYKFLHFQIQQCTGKSSQFVNEDDVKSAHDEMYDNVPDGTVDISTVIGNALGFQLSDKHGDRPYENGN
ncbi:unnamed protein product [Schistosoma intercalatum]|nr:unnamed protein product [Schistosoma intercalatum]CAH8581780.1 unnamed protein product [Schistosoma intercalatum]